VSGSQLPSEPKFRNDIRFAIRDARDRGLIKHLGGPRDGTIKIEAFVDMTTHGEERAEYIRLMGPTLGQVSHELRGEYWLLAQKWREYKNLFDEGEEQAVLLNTVASNFFGFLKFVLFEDVMLRLRQPQDD
jgi:hypothetical protein